MRNLFLNIAGLVIAFFVGIVVYTPAAAAADVEFNADTILSGDWDSFATVTAKSGCDATSFDVRSSMIVITVAAGDSCTLETDVGTFTTTGSDTVSCGPPIQLTTNGAATSVEVTPTNSTCTAPASGGTATPATVTPAPSAPTNFKVSCSGAAPASCTLTWTDPPKNATTVEIWRGAKAPIVQLTSVGIGKQTYKDTSVKVDTTHCYQLVAASAGGRAATQEACATPKAATTTTTEAAPTETATADTTAKPKLELTLSAKVLPAPGTALAAAGITSPIRAIPTLAFALSLSLLLMGGFLIHLSANPDNGPSRFLAIFPLMFTSPAYSFERLAARGETGYLRSYARYKRMISLSRFTFAATVATGIVKLMLAFVLVTAMGGNFVQRVFAQTETVNPKDQVELTATLKNTGTARATNVVLNVPTAKHTAYVSGSAKVNGSASTLTPQGGAFSVPFTNLQPSSAHNFQVRYEVLSSAVDAVAISFSATASAAELPATAPTVSSSALTFKVALPPASILPPEKIAQPKLPEEKVEAPKEAPKIEPLPKPQQEAPPLKVEPVEPPKTQQQVIEAQKAAPEAIPGALLPVESVPAPESVVGGQQAGLPAAPPPVAEAVARRELAAPRFAVRFDARSIALAENPAAIGGQVPVVVSASGSLPPALEGRVARVEMVVQSEPQVFSCALSGSDWNCEAAPSLPPGSHTLFAQATDFDGSVGRLTNVVQFDVILPACFDGIDNDGDGLIDYPDDPGCKDRADSDELEPVAVALAPILPKAAEETVAKVVAAVQTSKPVRAVKAVVDNPVVEEATVNVVAPVVTVAVAANATAAVAQTAAGVGTLWAYLQGFFTQPLLLFTRRRRKQWGLVYSALTKLPIDLALVRLFNAQTDRLAQTRVTDKEGRYLFITDPGKYRIQVAKPGFTFPSEALKDKNTDLDFVDLYHGDPIEITARATTIVRPIPVDPIEKTETPKEVLARRRRRGVQKGVAWSGPVLAMASVVINPTLTTAGLVGLQFALLGLFKRLAEGKKPKSWGSVVDIKTGKPIQFAVSRIFDAQFNKLLETQITDKEGRYAFLVGRGNFYITVQKPGYEIYKSETADLSKAGAAEIIRRDIKLRPGTGGGEAAPPLTPPPSPPTPLPEGEGRVRAEVGVPTVQSPTQADQPAPPPGAIGVPTVQAPSQANEPQTISPPVKNHGNGNGKKNGNGIKKGNGNGRKNGNGKISQ